MKLYSKKDEVKVDAVMTFITDSLWAESNNFNMVKALQRKLADLAREMENDLIKQAVESGDYSKLKLRR